MLSNGITYAGRRPLHPNPPQGAYVWQNLTDPLVHPLYPKNVCDTTISSHGNDTWVKVLTTDGFVWETHCASNGQTLVCTEPWAKLTTPTP
ncbi:hypothetical protein FCI23_55265 [Actinacidiphila oryziradicis]|uniref:Uncharacterized protein n=1 Tax=Actinacidiphila oryziradicis TaxID=2571141 RepID=A0A4U0RA40_9ACTN|nr:hypothetical protein FCI23_55265 [Actinacidiphila oryziradicis]